MFSVLTFSKGGNMKRFVLLSLVLLFALGSVFANGNEEVAYPSQQIELVIPASAGGGSDIMGRLLVEIIQDLGLTDQTIVPVNKGGGSGSVGQAYVCAKSNQDYTIFTINDGHTVGANKAGTVPEGNFTPLASLGVDNVLFVTGADSPYTTFAEALAASQAKPKELTVGCADDIDKVCVYNIDNETGSSFNTVYFNSAGEICTAILGGHIEFGMLNPSECSGLVEAGQLKVLATMGEERCSYPFEDAPTFVELGYTNLVYYFSRGMMAGPKMSREAQLWWSDAFEKVCQSEKWQNYCDQNGIVNKYMNCDDYKTFYIENEKSLVEAAKKVGAL